MSQVVGFPTCFPVREETLVGKFDGILEIVLNLRRREGPPFGLGEFIGSLVLQVLFIWST